MQVYNPYLCLLSLHFPIPNPLSASAASHFSAHCGRCCQQRHTPDAFPQSPILLLPLLCSSQAEVKVIPIANFCLYLVFPAHSVNSQRAKQSCHNRYHLERIWRQKDLLEGDTCKLEHLHYSKDLGTSLPCKLFVAKLHQPHLEQALRNHPCLRAAV